MKTVTNRFGTGEMLEEQDLKETNICFVSTACLSTTSDAVSYVQSIINKQKMKGEKKYECIEFVTYDLGDEYKDELQTKIDLWEDCTVIVLGCQVTDIAILNDIRTLEMMHERYPQVKMVMGGCLAYRFDIELPSWCERIEAIRQENISLTEEAKDKVAWVEPFWVDDLGIDSYGEKSGSLFRNSYPLKIGAGCHGKCSYCTIRDTRGQTYEQDAYLQVQELIEHKDEDIVLTSDSPTVNQVKDWCELSIRYGVPISFRNVEPSVALNCMDDLLKLASMELLKVLHCPIQSNNADLIKAMGRNATTTMAYIKEVQKLREYNVIVATNIIIDYTYINDARETITEKNMDTEFINNNFDYWVWNPHFDGKWSREKAEERYKRYIKH